MATTYDATKDPYANQGGGPDTLGTNSAVVAKSDTTDFTVYPKAVVVTATGDVDVLPLTAVDDGTHIIPFRGVNAGFIIPFRVRRVMATGTTASVATIAD
jgi:hypothetical protein